MKLTRRRLFEGAVAATLGGIGIDALVERLDGTSRPPLHAAQQPIEQHLLPHAQTMVDDGVELLVPPLHHRVITARLRVAETPAALREARVAFERALARVEAAPEPPAVTVAWGLPYFRRLVPAQAQRELPVDRRASGSRGRQLRVLEDAERFPSDPDATMLEGNDVAVLLRSDELAAIEDAQRRLFDELPEIFQVTSVRKGFVGGGFGGDRSLPKRMVESARVPGADLMPAAAQLFLGFTSSVKRALGPAKIANFESLGYADLPSGYFVGGTHMHLSHIAENLLAWYLNFDHRERVAAMFRPGLEVPVGALTVRQAPADVADERPAPPRLRTQSPHRARGRDSGGLATRPRRREHRWDALPQGNGGAPARRLQHARQSIRLERPIRRATV